MAVLFTLCLAALALYLFQALVSRPDRRPWSRLRTASFVAGMALVLASLAPPLAAAAHHDLRLHMVQHLLLGMLGPVGIVLGAPLTLALRSLPTPAARRLAGLLRTPLVHLLAHPLPALVLNVGGMAALYLTPIFLAMDESAGLHTLVHFHFLAAGCLFSWSIAGSDPGPRRPSRIVRLAGLFVATAAHATLGKFMFARGLPAGTGASLAEVEQAARIMYYGGDLAELLLAIALFATWPWPRPAGEGRPVQLQDGPSPGLQNVASGTRAARGETATPPACRAAAAGAAVSVERR